MQGRSSFTRDEANQIRALLRQKVVAERSEQKASRQRLRNLGFYISDFARDAGGFTASDFDDLVNTGAVIVVGHEASGLPKVEGVDYSILEISDDEEGASAIEEEMADPLAVAGTSPLSLFIAAGVEMAGSVGWGVPIPSDRPGVYVVSLDPDAASAAKVICECPVSLEATAQLLSVRPELLLDGRRPSAEELMTRIGSAWFPDEVVLYVGLAGTSLRSRVRQYYRTPLGARKPHAGGWFLKVLSNLDELTVHFAEVDAPASAESMMISTFCAGTSLSSREGLMDGDRPFPFANLEWPKGTRKRHGVTGATGDL